MSKVDVLLRAEGIHKSYHMDLVDVPVLKGVDLSISSGEFLAIVGVSGSGKSTLLHILGALDEPDSGNVIFDSRDVFSAEEGHRHELRNTRFGFVFQFYHLLPELTVLENVLMPRLVGSSVAAWLSAASRAERDAIDLLDRLGLAKRVHHLPNQLSGGERQRVAIARAVVNRPTILFADEPTGNLDAETGREILNVLLELHRNGQTVAMVTHDPQIARSADRIVQLHDGRIKGDV